MEPVRIEQLRLRAAEADRPAALAELERATWPDGGEDWILVRSVHVRAPRPWLGPRAAASARHAVAAAVPVSAPGADEAPAVRFANQAELLAYLGADLLDGVADDHWYWHGWPDLLRLPPLEAATRLWTTHVAHLPAVTAVLSRIGRLHRVWSRLDEAALGRLEDGLADHAGVALRGEPGTQPATAPADPVLPAFVVERWAPVTRGLPPDRPALRLAAALALLESRPTALLRAPEDAIRAVSRRLQGRADGEGQPAPARTPPTDGREDRRDPRPRGPDAVPDSAATVAPELPQGLSRREGPSASPPAEKGTGEQPPSTASDSPDTPPTTERTGERNPGARPQHASPAATGRWRTASGTPPGAATESSSVEPPLFGELVSNQAGTLFLINALNHPAVGPEVEAHGGWDALPGGWAWLYRLGQLLGLSRDDPLAAFLATQLGLDHVDELDALPALPGGDRLPGLLSHAYGEAWKADLIEIPGRVAYTPSHVDAFLPMAAVRLEVRFAGLDVDPGWVPWLGRVVTFHYRDTGHGT